MNNAWKLKHDYGKVQEKCDVVLPILEVWRFGFDCKCFLAMSGMCWNAFEALNCALGTKSVSRFLAKNCKLVIGFLSFFRS